MRTLAALVVLLGVLTPTLSGQTVPAPKKFLGGPLVIEDQGSFFVGGVQKITDYASALPPPAPGTAAPSGPGAAADHHRPDVRAVPDSGQEVQRRAGR